MRLAWGGREATAKSLSRRLDPMRCWIGGGGGGTWCWCRLDADMGLDDEFDDVFDDELVVAPPPPIPSPPPPPPVSPESESCKSMSLWLWLWLWLWLLFAILFWCDDVSPLPPPFPAMCSRFVAKSALLSRLCTYLYEELSLLVSSNGFDRFLGENSICCLLNSNNKWSVKLKYC